MTSLTPRVMVGWTGHRPDLFADPLEARSVVRMTAERLLNRHGACVFVSGGQRGVDQWAADTAIERGTAFHLVLPQARDMFTNGWLAADRSHLDELLRAAASVETVDPTGELGVLAYDLRSEALVRRCDVLVAVWGGVRRGGTYLTLCAARARGLVVEETRVRLRDGAPLQGRGV